MTPEKRKEFEVRADLLADGFKAGYLQSMSVSIRVAKECKSIEEFIEKATNFQVQVQLKDLKPTINEVLDKVEVESLLKDLDNK